MPKIINESPGTYDFLTSEFSKNGIAPDEQFYLESFAEYNRRKLLAQNELADMSAYANLFDLFDPEFGGNAEYDDDSLPSLDEARTLALTWIQPNIAEHSVWSRYSDPYVVLQRGPVKLKDYLLAIALDSFYPQDITVIDMSSKQPVTMTVEEALSDRIDALDSLANWSAVLDTLAENPNATISDRVSAFTSKISPMIKNSIALDSIGTSYYRSLLSSKANYKSIIFSVMSGCNLFSYTSAANRCTDPETGEISESALSSEDFDLFSNCQVAQYTGASPLSSYSVGDFFSGLWKGVVGVAKGVGNMVAGIFGTSLDAIGSFFSSMKTVLKNPIDVSVINEKGDGSFEGLAITDLQEFYEPYFTPYPDVVNGFIPSVGSINFDKNFIYAPLQFPTTMDNSDPLFSTFKTKLFDTARRWNSHPKYYHSNPFCNIVIKGKLPESDSDGLYPLYWQTLEVNNQDTGITAASICFEESLINDPDNPSGSQMAVALKPCNPNAIRKAILSYLDDCDISSVDSNVAANSTSYLTLTKATFLNRDVFLSWYNNYVAGNESVFDLSGYTDQNADRVAIAGTLTSAYLMFAFSQCARSTFSYNVNDVGDVTTSSSGSIELFIVPTDSITGDDISNRSIVTCQTDPETGFRALDSFYPRLTNRDIQAYGNLVATSIFLNLFEESTFPADFPYVPYCTEQPACMVPSYRVATDSDRARAAKAIVNTLIGAVLVVAVVVTVRSITRKIAAKRAWKREQTLATLQNKMWQGHSLTKKEMKAYKRALKKGGVASLLSSSPNTVAENMTQANVESQPDPVQLGVITNLISGE